MFRTALCSGLTPSSVRSNQALKIGPGDVFSCVTYGMSVPLVAAERVVSGSAFLRVWVPHSTHNNARRFPRCTLVYQRLKSSTAWPTRDSARRLLEVSGSFEC